MKVILSALVLLFSAEAFAVCNSWTTITISGMTSQTKVAKLEVSGNMGDTTKPKLKLYLSSLKTYQGQMESCKMVDVIVGTGYPGPDTVREWARLATVAMTLNYDLNINLGNTSQLSYTSTVELVPPAAP